LFHESGKHAGLDREKVLATMLLLAYGNIKENTCFEVYKKKGEIHMM